MSTFYNVEAAIVDLIFTVNDDVNMTFTIEQNDVAYDMTGMTLDMHVKKCDGTLVKSFTTTGGSPTITIVVDEFTIHSTGFTKIGRLKYDVQVIDLSSHKLTIMKGNLFVQSEQTA